MGNGADVPSSEVETPRRKFRWPAVLRLLFGLGILGVVLYYSDLEEFAAAAAKVSPGYLLAFAALVYVDRILVVYKWRLLLTARQVFLPFVHLFNLYSIALLAGVVLPSTVGGDVLRVYDLKRLNVSAKISIASIIVERVIGFVCMLIVAALGLGIACYLMVDSAMQFAGIGATLAFALALCAGMFILIRNDRFNRWLAEFSERNGHRFAIGKLYNVYHHCREYRNDPGLLGKVTLYTFLRQTMPIFLNLMLVYAFDIQASFLGLAAVIPLIVLGLRLPISLDGIGVQEGLYVVLLGLVGVTPSQGLLMSLTFRVMSMLCTLPFGLAYFLNNRPDRIPSSETGT